MSMPVRSQTITTAPVRQPKNVADSTRPNINSLLAHYAQKPQNVQSEPKILYSNVEKGYNKNVSEHKKNEKVNFNGAQSRSCKEDVRNPLKKHLSLDEYITYTRKDFNSDNVRTKCKGDFIRSMSDESYGKGRAKQTTKKSSSINNLYPSNNLESLERSALNKFSQKHGIKTASALMELRSSIR